MIVKKECLRGACLIVGFLCLFYGGTAYIFSVYTNSIKKIFGYTQSEVGLISGFGNVGATFAFIPGILIDRFGPRVTSLLSIVVSTSGYLLLWSSVNDPSFYADKSWLVCLYIFIAYFSSNTSYMAGLITNMRNFTGRYRGTMVAILESAYSLGSVIFIAIYGSFFVNGHVSDEENQDVGGFFLTNAIIGATVNALAVVFLGYYETNEIILPDQNDYETLDDVSSEDNQFTTDESQSPEEAPPFVEDVTGLKLFKDWDFWFLHLTFVLSTAVILMFLTNINVYLKSFSIEQHSSLFNTVVPIAAVISKLSLGLLSDRTKEKVPRTFYILLPLILLFISLTVCIFASDIFSVLMFATVCVGIAYGASWGMSAVLVSEYFGLKYFGVNWGICVFSNGICSILLQKIYGVLYEAEITVPGETFCYGSHCFTWSFAVAAVLSGCAIVFNIGLIERRRRMDLKR